MYNLYTVPGYVASHHRLLSKKKLLHTVYSVLKGVIQGQQLKGKKKNHQQHAWLRIKRLHLNCIPSRVFSHLKYRANLPIVNEDDDAV